MNTTWRRALCAPAALMLWACQINPQILEVEAPRDTTDPVGPYRVVVAVSQDDLIRDLSILWSVRRPDAGPPTVLRERMQREVQGVFEGAIPGQPAGSEVEFTVQLRDKLGGQQRDPPDGGRHFHVLHADGGR